ncbi:membrane protein [Arthrobacter phage Thunderclap]|uniref:Membrane protein n=1 Tax=Arthrobacter phage Thunderclap TaxID=2777309 RepID=A0A7M1RQK1_9CAUD|nr:membrane protein [Arthrobacter phage Thunderclap]QOR56144.1 membrane protein [Arthrobacter phage Thunderclap]
MRTLIQTKAMKRCGKRDHGYVVNMGTGEICSGCIYCGYNPGSLGVAAVSRPLHWLDVASRAAIVACTLALTAVLWVCAAWLWQGVAL